MTRDCLSHRLSSQALAGSVVACALSCQQPLPARGEAVLVIDTDLSVPEHAGEFRLDLYTRHGTWYASRTIALPSVQDWPPSFSLYAPKGEAEAIARLRVYPRGATRDYLGERFATRKEARTGTPLAIAADPPTNGAPRLVVDGIDVTPDQEPHPLVTIDRLVIVRLVPGVVGGLRVVLRGACAGTMADIANLASCIDQPDQIASVEPAELQTLQEALAGGSLAGEFAAPVPCEATPRSGSKSPGGTDLFDEERCVPGGAFHLGEESGFGDHSYPPRLIHIQPFLMDKYEVTVGRWRDAIQRGFQPDPERFMINDGPIKPSIKDGSGCTYTSMVGERESYPMNCVTHDAIREFCRFNGGDLPTEAQWEWAATAEGRPFKTRFPWGNEQATCDQAVFQRTEAAGSIGDCADAGLGPQPVTEGDTEHGDRTPGAGVVGLAGSVAEFTRDMYAHFASNCWMATPVNDPACDDSLALEPEHTVRGGSWAQDTPSTDDRAVQPFHAIGTFIGFRCVRPGGP